jgi:competence protein ComEA
MNHDNVAHGASSAPTRARGRDAAPRVTYWLPAAAKVSAAVVAAVVLAIIGATAGARPPAVDELAAVPSQGAAAARDASPPIPADLPAVASDDAGAPPASGVMADGRVILNVASEEELTRLPGIGPSRARAIVALRQRLAKFRAVEDLLRVKGIGRKTLRRIKPSVVLDRPADGGVSGRTSPADARSLPGPAG